MTNGCEFGIESHTHVSPLSIFISDRKGYTTTSIACVLLVTLSLIFSLATLHWISSRAADIQEVADATALAGSNCVSSFVTIVHVLDAFVLSLGLVGMLVYAVGLVAAAVPILNAFSPPLLDVGTQVFVARQRFAQSAYAGIQKFEQALPALIAYNSLSCAYANSSETCPYVGLAVPYPLVSKSSYPALTVSVDSKDLNNAGKQLRDQSKELEALENEMSENKLRAYQADCVDNPHCMRSRAADLAYLDGSYNRTYSYDEWEFEFARQRAESYYAQRQSMEVPKNLSWDEYCRSCARKQFYSYAYKKISAVTCQNDENLFNLPELPHNADSVRGCELYTDKLWPASYEDGQLVAHCSTDYMNALPACYVSLQEIEQGVAKSSSTDAINMSIMGKVASASTNINNGFEYYWKIFQQAARAYAKAQEKAGEVQQKMQDQAETTATAFDKALALIGTGRPHLCPPGAYGCVAFVIRSSELKTPENLVSSFTSSAQLPGGIALSATTLAPDATDSQNAVLKRTAEEVKKLDFPLVSPILSSLCTLWADLLENYGSLYDHMSSITDGVFGSLSFSGNSKIGMWLKHKLGEVITSFGFEPVDLRLLKPVRVNSQYVLHKAGLSQNDQLRAWIEKMPRDPQTFKKRYLEKLKKFLGDDSFTIAQIPKLGSEESYPIRLDLSFLLEK